MFFRDKNKLKKVMNIYTELLNEEINKIHAVIRDIEEKKDNVSDKVRTNELILEMQFLKGQVHSYVRVARDLRLISRNNNLMDDWGIGSGLGNVKLRL